MFSFKEENFLTLVNKSTIEQGLDFDEIQIVYGRLSGIVKQYYQLLDQLAQKGPILELINTIWEGLLYLFEKGNKTYYDYGMTAIERSRVILLTTIAKRRLFIKVIDWKRDKGLKNRK